MDGPQVDDPLNGKMANETATTEKGREDKGKENERKYDKDMTLQIELQGLPAYITDKEILDKLHGWGVSAVSLIKRRMWPGTNIADGTRYLKVFIDRVRTFFISRCKLRTLASVDWQWAWLFGITNGTTDINKTTINIMLSFTRHTVFIARNYILHEDLHIDRWLLLTSTVKKSLQTTIYYIHKHFS
uniref:uncharacterized protein LOC122769119 isoform X2 n=1 Tax=Solea senegalensis TaxID=28829 RepID=UPI001CD885E7|nr:uncharacterized protein LOC122769119 isoform X2 [Solea senegalensis]